MAAVLRGGGAYLRGPTVAARIEVTAHTVADLDRRLGQIDSAIEAHSAEPTTLCISEVDRVGS